MPPSTLFPSSNAFSSSLPLPESPPVVQETEKTRERKASRARSRSRSDRKVTFVLDPRSGHGPGDLGERSKRVTGDSPSIIGGSSGARDEGRRVHGKSEVNDSDSCEEGGVGIDPNLSPERSRVARGRTPGPGRR